MSRFLKADQEIAKMNASASARIESSQDSITRESRGHKNKKVIKISDGIAMIENIFAGAASVAATIYATAIFNKPPLTASLMGFGIGLSVKLPTALIRMVIAYSFLDKGSDAVIDIGSESESEPEIDDLVESRAIDTGKTIIVDPRGTRLSGNNFRGRS